MALDQQTLDRLKIDRNTRAGSSGSWKWGAWILVAVVLIGISLFWFRSGRVLGSTPELATLVVREETGAETGGHTVLNASGYVTPRREATVSAKMTGKVIEVMVEEGKRVEANQILARLDPSNLTVSRKLAEAQMNSARVGLKEVQAQLKEAQLRYERSKRLQVDRITSTAEVDRSEADYKALEARLEHQAMEVVVATRTVEVWDQQLEDTVIRAPFAGIVTAKNAQPGEVISPMSAGGFTRTGICTLVDMTSLEIEVEVNESYLNRVTPGQKVDATLDAYTDWKIPAHVIAIIPTADRQKATVKVRVGFDALDPRILPQMGVKVGFRSPETVSSSPSVPAAPRKLIPRAAILEKDGKQIVWRVQGGKLERRAVTAKVTPSGELDVIAGLSDGDRLVLDPPATLIDGASVRVR